MIPADDKQYDVLIIGAGLAGSILAYKLISAGLRSLVVNDPSIPSASRAAAGLINPVTGQRMVLQNNIEALLASAHAFYKDIENIFGVSLLHQREMLRLFQSEKERSAWQKRLSDPLYTPYIDNHLSEDSAIHAELGGFIQSHTGNLDTNLLLDTLHDWFRQQGVLIEAPFTHDQINFKDDLVLWQQIESKKVIFCEGWRGQHNPWFSWLPFQPAKGEILTLKSESPVPDQIINHGKWILPISEMSFKFGATYEREELNETTTQSAKEELLGAMAEIFVESPEVQVTHQDAGVRPGTKDKQPFLGFLHDQTLLGIFNGFGSKGSLLIPWYAEAFASHMTQNSPLPLQADIERFHA